MSYQKMTIIGFLGRDPEMRYTPDGTAVTSFSVATSKSWTDAGGAKQERTVWFRVTAWKKLAEICHQYLAKGRQVFIEGELSEPKPYQAKDGEWRASLELRAYKVVFLGSKGDASPNKSASEPSATSRPAATGEEEIPF